MGHRMIDFAGHMMSEGAMHRISINRTAHRAYAYRSGGSPMRRVPRRASCYF
jgi:AraC family transcriptional regulator